MDVISFSEAATANSRIEIINANPDSSSGIVTAPKTIASGEKVTIPSGRVAILPNVQIDGVLNVEGEVFIPSGSTLSTVVEKVTSTDNAIVRFDGTTGAVQNSSVTIDDNGNVLIGMTTPASKLHVQGNIRAGCSSVDAVNTRGIIFDIDGSIHGRLAVDNTDNLLFFGSGIGYGAGSGGTVTQLTDKSTSVTLNKPSGMITMNKAVLHAGASASFIVNNSLITTLDNCIITISGGISGYSSYRVQATSILGGCVVTITNTTSGSLSEAVRLKLDIIKGAIS